MAQCDECGKCDEFSSFYETREVHFRLLGNSTTCRLFKGSVM